MDARVCQKPLEHRRGVRAGHEQIQIADRLLTAPQATRRRDIFDAFQLAQVSLQLACGFMGVAQKVAARAHAVLRDRP